MIASVAEEAGVTRLTVYRHFADLDALFEACTAHWMARNPPPDAETWRRIPQLEARARTAFTELYSWHRDHAAELYPIYRDAAAMPRSAQDARAAANSRLADALIGESAADDETASGDRLLAALARHLVHFWTWHSLVSQQGLDDGEAVDLAVRLVTGLARPAAQGQARTPG